MLVPYSRFYDNDLFNRFFEDAFTFDRLPRSKYDENGVLTIELDVPGISKEDVTVKLLHNKTLTIEAKNSSRHYSHSETLLNVDPDSIDVHVEHGVLTLKAKRKEDLAVERILEVR